MSIDFWIGLVIQLIGVSFVVGFHYSKLKNRLAEQVLANESLKKEMHESNERVKLLENVLLLKLSEKFDDKELLIILNKHKDGN